MSPRAAWRLESVGFTAVYHYAAGEADWFAYGLPMEGEQASMPRAAAVACRDVPRCGLSEPISTVRERARAAGWDLCVVVNEEEVVLGLLRNQDFDADPQATAEQVMRSGPATYRPDALLDKTAEQLRKRNVSGVLITRSDGTLLGWLRREDAEHPGENLAGR